MARAGWVLSGRGLPAAQEADLWWAPHVGQGVTGHRVMGHRQGPHCLLVPPVPLLFSAGKPPRNIPFFPYPLFLGCQSPAGPEHFVTATAPPALMGPVPLITGASR